MLPNASDMPLTISGQRLCARARKHLTVFATHSNRSLVEAAALAVAEPPPRRRPGPMARDWRAVTGYPLSRLTLMILFEQALAKGSSKTWISSEQALGLILKSWRKEEARAGRKVAVNNAGTLLKAYQHAVRNPPSIETQTDQERRDFRGAIAWLDHLERQKRGKVEPEALKHVWRAVRHEYVWDQARS